jgi:hypothetical protein
LTAVIICGTHYDRKSPHEHYQFFFNVYDDLWNEILTGARQADSLRTAIIKIIIALPDAQVFLLFILLFIINGSSWLRGE